MTDLRLAELFQTHFDIVPAVDEYMLDKVFRIRHQVYCEELGFESRRADGLERDDFDKNAIHCLLRHKPSQTYIGCVRLVLADHDSPRAEFPFERVCGESLRWDFAESAGNSRQNFGEISRLAIAGGFRRQRHQLRLVNGQQSRCQADDARQLFPSIALGLYLAIAAMGLSKGLDGVFAMMEPKLARQLRRFGICFEPVGDAVNHRGTRVPYFISRGSLLANLKFDCQALLNKIQKLLSAQSEPLALAA